MSAHTESEALVATIRTAAASIPRGDADTPTTARQVHTHLTEAAGRVESLATEAVQRQNPPSDAWESVTAATVVMSLSRAAEPSGREVAMNVLRSPAFVGVVAVGGFAFIYWLLGVRQEEVSQPDLIGGQKTEAASATKNGEVRWEDLSEAFVQSLPWITWKAVAALCACVAGSLLITGIAHLRSLRAAHPGRYVLAAVAFAFGVAFVISSVASGQGQLLPVNHFEWRTRALLILAAAAAVPWIASVWLIHLAVRDTKQDMLGGGLDVAKPKLEGLSELWRQISAAVVAFAAFVGIALLPTGALRSAAKAHQIYSAEPTQTTVLLYGAFFAVALTAVTLPLIGSWRTAGRILVDKVEPVASTDDLTEERVERRATLQAYLGLDKGILRSPLTAVSVLTPLITAVLATFIPELASK